MEPASDVDGNNWEREITKSGTLTVVYFWHEKCSWCFRLNPIFDEVVEEYRGKVKFAKLDVFASPTNQEIASNFGVMSTPTLLFLCGGRPVGQVVGLMSKEDLERGLNDMLTRYKGCLRQSTELRQAYIV